ncbi:MAG: aminotransferase class I/II-fold pyridoxal phosphate-dependent enzyme [Nanoarchaeota archaeon]|nr:aminotransferase class I/II-fold pyridoxal phosphate-dependent enzyme [Nanoarchaeota archaeon]
MKVHKKINNELEQLKSESRSKAPERIVNSFIPAHDDKGPRFLLEGQGDKEFIRMNSNDYLGLSLHPDLANAGDVAAKELGANAGGVRFISGTTKYHVALEKKLAEFHKKEAAKIFSCAYMANLGIALAMMNKETFVISDQLNHNSIARAIRIAGVKRENKGFYKHNDMEELRKVLDNMPEGINRVIVIFDGIFSMRGDYAPMKEIIALAKEYDDMFEDGVITIVDDSHGTVAYGRTGRGTPEVTDSMDVDIIVSTLGKGIGAEGGYVASSKEIIEMVRQKGDTYIYTNPVTPAGAAAGIASLEIIDSEEGIALIEKARLNALRFRKGIEALGYDTIPGIHPIVPVVLRDTDKVNKTVKHLYDKGILATGIIYPVVPKGDETIRMQLSASHTDRDIDYVLSVFKEAKEMF